MKEDQKLKVQDQKQTCEFHTLLVGEVPSMEVLHVDQGVTDCYPSHLSELSVRKSVRRKFYKTPKLL